MNTRTITTKKDRQREEQITRSAGETQAFAKRLANTLHGGDVLALSGELGSGKTTFVQGLAKALGIREQITSPTFVLMKIYRLPKPFKNITQLCHIDAYRLDCADELAAIGAGEYIGDAQTLTVIEWPELVYAMVPKQATWIYFSTEQRVNRLHNRFLIKTRRKRKDVSENVDNIVYNIGKKDK